MSNIEKAKKKKGKGKTKGAKGMPIEDYARKNNLSLDVNLTYENDEEEPKKNKKSNYLIYQENIIINRKNETPKKNKDISDKSDNNRKELEIDYNSSRSLNLEWHKQVSASTNNSSTDDENKNNNKEKKKNIIIKNLNSVNNIIK